MASRYSEERFRSKVEYSNKKFFPYLLDKNPFIREVGLGLKNFPKGRIEIKEESECLLDIAFSQEVRKKEIDFLNDRLEEFITDREPKVMWVCGDRGVGKTALLQYFFKKNLISSEIIKRASYWYVTYGEHSEVKFLYNPSKYLLEQLYKNLMEENVKNKIFHDAIAGTIFKFIVSDKFKDFKEYLKDEFSNEDFEEIRKGIETNGKEYIINLISNLETEKLNNIVKLLGIIKDSQILNVDTEYFSNFIKPFVLARLESKFLTEDRIRNFFEPKIKAQQESVLVNTIKFLTSGAFDHFILILDQIDVAWERSKTASRRKKDFFDGLSSLIRKLDNSGLIIIIAVMQEAAEEITNYYEINPEAQRIASDKHKLRISKLSNVEDIKILFKEYLNNNKYRQEQLNELKTIEENKIVPAGLFPFDDSALEAILKQSRHKTINDILDLASQYLDICVDRLDQAETSEQKKLFEIITGATIKEITS